MGGTVTTNQTTQLQFTQFDETWIVAAGVSIAVAGDNAVLSNAAIGAANSTLINRGEISANGLGHAGVFFTSYGGVITNSGKISSDSSNAIRISNAAYAGATTLVKNQRGG